MIAKYKALFSLRCADRPAQWTEVVDTVARWASFVQRVDLPTGWSDRITFPDGAALEVLSAAEAAAQVHTARFDRLVNGVRWVTEVGARITTADCHVFVGLSSGLHDPAARRAHVRPPGIVSQLVSRYSAWAGMPLSSRVIEVLDAGDVTALVDLLTSPSRQLPIVCLSVDDFSEEPLVEEEELQKRLLGLAQVVLLTKRAAFALTHQLADTLGDWQRAKTWGVYGGAIRLFWPGIDFSSGGNSPFRHRLLLPRDGTFVQEEVFDDLFESLSWAALHREQADWVDTNYIQRLNDRRAIDEARSAASTDASIYDQLYKGQEEVIATLRAHLAEAMALKDAAERNFESLRWDYRELQRRFDERRGTEDAVPDNPLKHSGYVVCCFHRGGRADRDCVDEAASSDDERMGIRARLGWLADPENWANPAGRLSSLGDGLFEYRVNVKDHWFRLFVAKLPKLNVVVVLNAYPKKSNDLDLGEVKTAGERLRDLL